MQKPIPEIFKDFHSGEKSLTYDRVVENRKKYGWSLFPERKRTASAGSILIEFGVVGAFIPRSSMAFYILTIAGNNK